MKKIIVALLYSLSITPVYSIVTHAQLDQSNLYAPPQPMEGYVAGIGSLQPHMDTGYMPGLAAAIPTSTRATALTRTYAPCCEQSCDACSRCIQHDATKLACMLGAGMVGVTSLIGCTPWYFSSYACFG